MVDSEESSVVVVVFVDAVAVLAVVAVAFDETDPRCGSLFFGLNCFSLTTSSSVWANVEAFDTVEDFDFADAAPNVHAVPPEVPVLFDEAVVVVVASLK